MEEYTLRVCMKGLLRIIFGVERKEIAASRRKLHVEELHNLYTSTNIFRSVTLRVMRWAGHVAQIGKLDMH
jgi:hypothetical protein